MKIKQGGQTERMGASKIEEITINQSYTSPRIFEVWINGNSLSYVSLEELLCFKEEIDMAIRNSIK